MSMAPRLGCALRLDAIARYSKSAAHTKVARRDCVPRELNLGTTPLYDL